jgi:transposase
MRGSDRRSGSLFSYVDLEARVRSDHPLRPIREIANAALADLTGEFAELYPPRLGRPSIAPERLLRAMLLQAFYGIRSERQRMEFDLLFRWFVGLGVDDPAWDHSSFTKNRERMLEGEIAGKFLTAVVSQPKVKRLCRAITSRSTARCWRLGRRSRASGARTGTTTTPRARAAMLSGASIRRSARTRRTAARPTPRLVFTERVTANPPSSTT